MLLALIVQSKADRTESLATASPHTTLIVAKLSLLPQWSEEIRTKTSLTFLVYYGQGKMPTTAEMSKVDVVITTYGTIQGELKRANPVIMRHHWLRVILDEAHSVRNEGTLASKVCSKMIAEHRWCATGTVIQNSLNDVYGIMKFLHHEPWCFSSFWKAAVSNPMRRASASADDNLDDEARQEDLNLALDRVRRLLSPLMLRRTKDFLGKDGQPILTLPPIEMKTINVDLSETEREFYNALLAKSRQLFEGFVEKGTLSKSYFQVFSLLSRLRQATNHIALTVQSRWTEKVLPSVGEGIEDATTSDDSDSALDRRFLQGLLEKFCAHQTPSPKKKKREGSDIESESDQSGSAKRPKEGGSKLYFSQMAEAVTDAVRTQSDTVAEECPICLEFPKIEEAVLTPCGTCSSQV